MRILILSLLSLFLAVSPVMGNEKALASKAELGEKLYFDVNLSKNRTQACATCHNPQHGFVDNRPSLIGKAVSLGDDGQSLGDRNAPSAAYARFSPDFHRNKKGKYVGGQFLDGREKNLAGQAGGPPLNSLEMGMPDKATVVERLRENAVYITAFKQLFGSEVFDQPETAYAAMAESISEFEKTGLFAPFDSKYDRYLRGEVELTDQESLGESLFFSNQFTNCNRCHQLKAFPGSEGETFSNYEFHNLGVPVNRPVRKANGKSRDFVDRGLFEHPDVRDEREAGKFRVPTLRNVAITGPYMHNGVFNDLRTVVLFYDKFNNRERKLNPETGQQWEVPEVDRNLALKEQDFQAPALKDTEVDALVAFMKTLTDQRYEHLLEQ